MSTTRPEDTPLPTPNPEHKAGAPEVLRRGDQPPPLPRWVYGFGIAVIVLVVVFFVVHFAGLMPMHG
jgi:hypothetical protein